MQQAHEEEPVTVTIWRSDLNKYIRVQHTDCPKGFSRSNARTIPTGTDRIIKRDPNYRGMRMSNRSHKHRKQWITSVVERSVLRYSTGG